MQIKQYTNIYLATEQYSFEWVKQWAPLIVAPLVMTFRGEIGAGKTTLIRSMLRILGIKSSIKSPTFSLVESYELDKFCVHHFDLYRIHDEDELDLIGFRDYFTPNALCCIEWPERSKICDELADVAFDIKFNSEGRNIHLSANTFAGHKILEKMHDATYLL